jgi:hypothetical protein
LILDPGWVTNQDPDLGSGIGMNNPDHISGSLETIFWVIKFFDSDPGSGMEKIRIRDGKYSDPGSGINIPDPQHCLQGCVTNATPYSLIYEKLTIYF